LEPRVGRLDLARERPVVRVVLEQVSGRVRIGDVVGPDPLDVGALLIRGAEHIASDPPEAVDTDAHRHARTSFSTPYRQRRRAAGAAKASGSPSRDDLYPEAVGVAQVRRVVALTVLRAHPRRAVVAAPGSQAALVRGIDCGLAVGAQRHVTITRTRR